MKRAEEINCLPVGAELPPLKDMPGFKEWSESPIALELLARIEAKVISYRRKAETRTPYDNEVGICEGLEAAFREICGGSRAIPPAIFTRT